MRHFFLSSALALVLGISGSLLTQRFIMEPIALLGTFVSLVRTENSGIAFGVTFHPLVQTLLIAAALVLVLWIALRTARSTVSQWGCGLLAGGALANIIDRIGDGAVTDIFKVGSFPVFNVADSAITIGVALLLLEAWRERKKVL